MNLTLAPETGTMYAIYKDRVEYKHYNLKDLQEDSEVEKNLLELHLFDSVSEYRLVKSCRKQIEICVNDTQTEFDDKYIEKVYTDKLYGVPEQIEVVNYITYDENDLAMINNYRLKEVN